jgi:hypothetical protein
VQCLGTSGADSNNLRLSAFRTQVLRVRISSLLSGKAGKQAKLRELLAILGAIRTFSLLIQRREYPRPTRTRGLSKQAYLLTIDLL